MKTLIDIKKHSNALARLVATVQLKEHGVECCFENASTAISMGFARSEVLEALNKDIGKTAEDLFNSQAIIKSIQNGKVTEFDSMYNTVEDVFGSTYNKEDGTITLSGVCFTIGGVGSLTKAELSAIVLQSIFGIDKKELSGVLKTLTRYEETSDEVEKAILYPSTILADKIISKITDQEIAYASFRKGLSYEQESEFNRVFNRTGVTGVIQNATYIDATGVKQTAPSHKAKDAHELETLLKGGKLKYIEAVECDGDGSLEKMTMLVKQIEKLELNTKVKFTFKARKLGNLKARGVFFPSHLIVAEDVRDTSAVLHELGHLIHMISHAADPFVNYLIGKLTPMIDLGNVKFPLGRGADYYMDENEVVARACEIGGLFARREGREAFADDAAFELIKSDQYYADQEGIYFNFTSFDETTKQELIALYELFYETSPDSVRDSRFDNYIKIDTNYRKVRKSFEDVIEDWKSKKEKELRELYSLVNLSTINSIVSNKGRLSIDALAMAVFTNISYCGNHNVRMTPSDWATVIEDKAGVVVTLMDFLHSSLDEKEMFMFLLKLRKATAWARIKSQILLGGFTDKFRPMIKKELQSIGATYYGKVVEFSKTIGEYPAEVLTAEMLSDEAFMEEAISIYPEIVARIDANLVSLETLVAWTRKVFESRSESVRYSSFVINKALGNHLAFMDEMVELNPELISMAGQAFVNDPVRMGSFIGKNVDKPYYLNLLGETLKDNTDFARSIVELNSRFLDYFSDRVKAVLANAGEVDLIAMEIEKLSTADTSYRRKVARKTQEVKVIEFLAKDRNEDVRIEVAKRDITPVSILVAYAKRKSTWLRKAVAENSNTPADVISDLLKEAGDDDSLLGSLAKNDKLSLLELSKIVKKGNRWVNWNLLRNPKISGFEHKNKLPAFREIVKTAIGCDEVYFAYEMRVDADFMPSVELLEDMRDNTDQYVNGSYAARFQKLAMELIEKRFPEKVKKIVAPEDLALGGLFAA